MTDTKALLDLAARCEAAAGADRELDAEIAMALGHAVEHPPGDDWFYAPETDGFGRKRVPAYTASLDAALMLVPEGHIAAVVNAGCDDPRAPDFTRGSAAVGLPNAEPQDAAITAATPALALCAASLRAIAQEQSK